MIEFEGTRMIPIGFGLRLGSGLGLRLINQPQQGNQRENKYCDERRG